MVHPAITVATPVRDAARREVRAAQAVTAFAVGGRVPPASPAADRPQGWAPWRRGETGTVDGVVQGVRPDARPGGQRP
jgi:hypothetical protein